MGRNESRPISRRAFVGLAAAGGAGLAFGGRSASAATTTSNESDHRHRDDEDDAFIEATIPELQRLMRRHRLSCSDLTAAYLDRIERLNPLLGAVIEVNPDAERIARQCDEERRSGHSRGPLHGIPVLIKDNIATADRMQTTAGSLALVGATVDHDSPVAARLRAAGAVILGKANLSEWANFRGFAPFNGWTGRGGFTRNPYLLSADPCGSSSGSAVAAAANLCAVAVGTETDGSIVCPSGNNLIVGIKPPIGMVPGDGIIPIAHSQDTAGPMTRTVTDANILLGVLANRRVPELHRGAMRGARIGVDRQMFTPALGPGDATNAVVEAALEVMTEMGATVIDTTTGDPNAYGDAELTVLIWEFKVQIAEYLAGVSGTSMHTLADLIQFNLDHCEAEMHYFGQEIFELAEATGGDLTAQEYVDARALCVRLTREEGIDAAIARDNLDAIVAPSYSYGSSPAAVAGYPNISVPVGINSEGMPAGVWMYGGRRSTTKLIRLGYDLEQEMQARTRPQFLGAIPPDPPDAGICTAAAAPAPTQRTAASLPTRWLRNL
ncbi:MAG: amidase [Ilumatobacteraceae bacterium]|nr:amidase [Ilumatobacteraceae bacterium]